MPNCRQVEKTRTFENSRPIDTNCIYRKMIKISFGCLAIVQNEEMTISIIYVLVIITNHKCICILEMKSILY